MTKKEIIQIAKIMMTADGGCCASDLLTKLDKRFPGFTESIQKIWEPEFESDFRE
jgi:hypothetical protein